MIAIDENGNIEMNTQGRIKSVDDNTSLKQNCINEIRCTQNTFDFAPSFGRNPIAWFLVNSVSDRILDIIRISRKYLNLRDVRFENGNYKIEF